MYREYQELDNDELNEVRRQLQEHNQFKSKMRGVPPWTEDELDRYMDGYEAGHEAAWEHGFDAGEEAGAANEDA